MLPIKLRIEGYPVIIKFKTVIFKNIFPFTYSIEGYPVIIRFKTANLAYDCLFLLDVLKVIQL